VEGCSARFISRKNVLEESRLQVRFFVGKSVAKRGLNDAKIDALSYEREDEATGFPPLAQEQSPSSSADCMLPR
jgi:hypothetical protein